MSTCVGWLSAEDIVTAGDDHKLIFWNAVSLEIVRKVDLPEHLFPTDLHVLPRKEASNRPLVFAISSVDGSFHIFDRSGRLEKSVQGHQGAIIVIRWAGDGTAIATGGEDGTVKMWSRTGMLRSTLTTCSCPIFTLSWSPHNDSIVFAADKSLEIKSLTPKIKSIAWKGHDRCILKVAWNSVNHTIVSASEDGRYKVWDENGRILFASSKSQYPITSLATSIDGSLIAIGSFNCICLCDQKGWLHSSNKLDTHSVFSVVWSSDSTQIAASTGSGAILLGHVVGREINWTSFKINSTDRNTITVTDIEKNVEQDYDFKENITKISVGFAYLLVITTLQCHIYKLSNLKLTHSLALKDSAVSLVIQSPSHFILVDAISVYLCSYEGRYLDALKWGGLRLEFLTSKTVSLSRDTVAGLDANEKKSVSFIDVQTLGKSKSTSSSNYIYEHKFEIDMISLDQSGSQSERKCAFIDRNSDLYITLVKSPSWALRTIKCQSMVSSIKWCDEANILSCLLDSGKLVVWLNPHAGFVDKELLDMCSEEFDLFSGSTKNRFLQAFDGNHIQIEISDGSKVDAFITPFAKMLHNYVGLKKWAEALQLCRYAKTLPESWQLWSSLAGFAIQHRNLEVAELAYSSILKVDKVLYIQRIQQIPEKSARNAEIALICGNFKEAENVLISSRYIFRAIQLSLEMYNWNRALELMNSYDKSGKYAALIVYYRRKYLERFGKEEDQPKLAELLRKVSTWITLQC